MAELKIEDIEALKRIPFKSKAASDMYAKLEEIKNRQEKMHQSAISSEEKMPALIEDVSGKKQDIEDVQMSELTLVESTKQHYLPVKVRETIEIKSNYATVTIKYANCDNYLRVNFDPTPEKSLSEVITDQTNLKIEYGSKCYEMPVLSEYVRYVHDKAENDVLSREFVFEADNLKTNDCIVIAPKPVEGNHMPYLIDLIMAYSETRYIACLPQKVMLHNGCSQSCDAKDLVHVQKMGVIDVQKIYHTNQMTTPEIAEFCKFLNEYANNVSKNRLNAVRLMDQVIAKLNNRILYFTMNADNKQEQHENFNQIEITPAPELAALFFKPYVKPIEPNAFQMLDTDCVSVFFGTCRQCKKEVHGFC